MQSGLANEAAPGVALIRTAASLETTYSQAIHATSE